MGEFPPTQLYASLAFVLSVATLWINRLKDDAQAWEFMRVEHMQDGQRQEGADHRVHRNAIASAHELPSLCIILQSVDPQRGHR